MRRIGVMGGTFDPIHYGHLAAAEEARAALGLERVIFVPTGCPPHKDPGQLSPAHHRYLMTVLATVDNPGFDVSRIDLDRPGVTYTVDTIRLLRAELGPEVELFFVMGADSLLDLLTWKEPAELLRLATLVAATRPGFGLEQLHQRLGTLYEAHRDRIRILEIPGLAISSTEIRQRVEAGRPIRYLVPDPVAAYIERHGLYRKGGKPAARPLQQEAAGRP